MMSEDPPGGHKRALSDSPGEVTPTKRQKQENLRSDPQPYTKEETFYDSSWMYLNCDYCDVHMPDLLTSSLLHGEKLVLHMHARYTVFSKSSRGDSASKEDVRAFKDEFLGKVCALRNERGGVLVIHVTEKSGEKGPSLDDFDQKVGEELSRMVEDDTLYVENYDRRWYSRQADSRTEYLDYIIVTVKGSSSVSTKDFNTLVTWDGSKERPKAREISRLLWRSSLQPCFASKNPRMEFIEGQRIDLYESRDVQLKRLYDKDLEKDLQENTWLGEKSLAYRIAFRLREKLHLLEYVTSFTKLRAGGSFFCGIEEEKLKLVVTVTDKPKSSKKSKKKKRKKEGDQQQEEVGGNPGVESRKETDNTGKIEDPSILNDIKKENNNGDNEDTESLLKSKDNLVSVPSSSDNQVINNMPNDTYIKPESKESSKLGNGLNLDKSLTNNNLNTVPVDVKPDSTFQITSDAQMSSSVLGKVEIPQGDGKDYKTAHNVVKGFKLSAQEREELRVEILSLMQHDMMWLRTDGTLLTPCEIEEEVDIVYHCTSIEQETYVTEIKMRHVFCGIAFYRSYGPDAFRLVGVSEHKPKVVRMLPSEWILLLRKAMQCDNCERPVWRLAPEELREPEGLS